MNPDRIRPNDERTPRGFWQRLRFLLFGSRIRAIFAIPALIGAFIHLPLGWFGIDLPHSEWVGSLAFITILFVIFDGDKDLAELRSEHKGEGPAHPSPAASSPH